jgi:hypothetical protein
MAKGRMKKGPIEIRTTFTLAVGMILGVGELATRKVMENAASQDKQMLMKTMKSGMSRIDRGSDSLR